MSYEQSKKKGRGQFYKKRASKPQDTSIHLELGEGNVVIPKKTPCYLIPFERMDQGKKRILLGRKVEKGFWFHTCIPWAKGWREITVQETGRKIYAYTSGSNVRNSNELVAIGGTFQSESTARQVAFEEFVEETGLPVEMLNAKNEFCLHGNNNGYKFFYFFIELSSGELDNLIVNHANNIKPKNELFRQNVAAKEEICSISVDQCPGCLDDEVSDLVLLKSDESLHEISGDWTIAALQYLIEKI